MQKLACKQDCPNCGGFGWVKNYYEIGHPMFGKFEPCPDASFYYLAQQRGDIGIGDFDYENLAWSKFQPNGNTLQTLSMVKSAIESGSTWITLWGNYGLGKTRILKTAVVEALKAGKFGAYVRMAEILQDLRDSYDDKDKSRSYTKRMEFWQSQEVLAIDEFDRINNTEWGNEQRFVLMDNRYDMALRGDGVTIVAMNTEPKKLDGYLFDRMSDGRFNIVAVKGESFRPRAEVQASIF